MAKIKKIKYVTQAELDALILAGTQELEVEYRIKDASVVKGATINGTSIVDANGVAVIPVAGRDALGVALVKSEYGVTIGSTGGSTNTLMTNSAIDSDIVAKNNPYKPICTNKLNKAIQEGLGNYNGTAFSDAEKATGRNTIGAWSAEEYDSTATSYADNTFFYVAED